MKDRVKWGSVEATQLQENRNLLSKEPRQIRAAQHWVAMVRLFGILIPVNFKLPLHTGWKTAIKKTLYFSIKNSKYIILRTEKIVLIFEKSNSLFTLSTEIKTIV